ncbi:hypothetical protein [Calidithermus chliarophilus]|uniref:hypothetical protein n=1 Tax=Calidithermus chliarophilus TaxID=52023 RepID=UPI0012F68A94|nr:hypothetical protein [Calidithermus chliarophilus]
MRRTDLKVAYELAVNELAECIYSHRPFPTPEDLLEEFKLRLHYRLYGDPKRLEDEEED